MHRKDEEGARKPAPSAGAPTSVRLLRRAQGGDASAQNELFRRHYSKLRVWARGRLPRWARDIADTTDIVQESILNVFRRLDRFEPRAEGALQAYLRQAVRNRIRDELRRAARQPAIEELDEVAVATGDASPLESAIGAEVAGRYRQALSQLQPLEREAIVARLELSYNYEQIAVALGKPSPDSARMAVSRGLRRLAREMDRLA